MHISEISINPTGEGCPTFYAGRKVTEFQQLRLWNQAHNDPNCPSRVLLKRFSQALEPIPIGPRHCNRLRQKWKLNRPRGRPRRICVGNDTLAPAEWVEITPRLSYVGVHLFADWVGQQELLRPAVGALKPAIEQYGEEHPEEDFPLLHHKEQTLMNRFQALFYAPLIGVGKLTQFDVKEHPLPTLVGRGYQSSTLTQFLGQLERIDASTALLPALVPKHPGQRCYIDGHMIAFWTRASMHKGKITMLGRIMAGSQAVVAHNEWGQALYVAYHPPDIRLTRVIVPYCQRVVAATGIELFVIDREVDSVAKACEFEERQLGLLSMLDSNEYDGLNSFETQWLAEDEEGSQVYHGTWKEPRPQDPRSFVIVVQADGRVLVYWGTSRVKKTLEPLEWPHVYRNRNDVQENSFKRMIEHGALNINYGIKRVVGPDRHQLRAQEKMEEALSSQHQRVAKKEEHLKVQQEKVAESKTKGHTTRLKQRERTLTILEEEIKGEREKEDKLKIRKEALGAPKQRADRDFRKQSIMTFRTLLLENVLLTFLAILCRYLPMEVGRETILSLLFERSGSRAETLSEVIYWISSQGLSAHHKQILAAILQGVNGMNLRSRGKPVRVRLRDPPS